LGRAQRKAAYYNFVMHARQKQNTTLSVRMTTQQERMATIEEPIATVERIER
jgi:hypothetical protein